jgi:hypothetical protein
MVQPTEAESRLAKPQRLPPSSGRWRPFLSRQFLKIVAWTIISQLQWRLHQNRVDLSLPSRMESLRRIREVLLVCQMQPRKPKEPSGNKPCQYGAGILVAGQARAIRESLQKFLKWEPKLDQGLPKQTQNKNGQRNHSLDTVKNSIKPLVHKSERTTIKSTEQSKDHEQGHPH